MGLATDVIGSMRNGAVDRAVSEVIRKVVQAVQETGKKGSVTLKLDISMMKDGDGEMKVKASIANKVPTADIPIGIYYGDDKGDLVRDNPKQLTFDAELSKDGKTVNLSARRMAGVSGDDL